MTKKSWKAMWTDHFQRKYAASVEHWKDLEKDDRLVFCNIYGMVMRALDSLPDDPDILVRSAMTNKLHEEQEIMDRISAVFAGR